MHLTLTSNIQYEQMAALFDLILCAFLVFDSNEDKEESSHCFSLLLYSITLANALEIVAVIVCSPDFRVPVLLKMITMSVDYFMNALVAFLFYNYIQGSSKDQSNFASGLMILNRVLLLFDVFMLLTNLFLQNTFYFDRNLVYHHGPYYLPVAFLFPAYYMMISSVIFKRNYHGMPVRKAIAILLTYLLNILGLILQAYFHGSMLIALPFASLGIYVLYFCLESPDYRHLEQTLTQLSEAKKDAEAASNAKDAFMTQITHEIRTPMNSIMGLTDMILQDMQGRDQLPPNIFSRVHQYMHNIANSSHQLIYIVDNMDHFEVNAAHDDGSSYAPAGEVPLQDAPSMELYAPDAHFLLVDDNEMNLFVAKKLLSRTGATISTCKGGLECLRALTTETYDMVFLDYMMPDMDGMDVLDRSRKLVGNRNATTPFIMLTANTVAGMETRALEAGFAAYISKPVDWNKFCSVLYAHLPKDKVAIHASDGSFQIQSASEVAATMELIDTAAGMEYCANDPDFYREALNVFAEEHPEKSSDITRFHQEQDWKHFTVRVHGLKSTARTMGAIQLSEKAKQLEDAGRSLQENPENSESLAFIETNLPAMLDLYEKTIAVIPHLKL